MASQSKKIKLDKTSIRAIGQISRGIIIGLGVLLALPIMNIPISGVVAFGGFGGIAATFAAKDLLANFFGSAMIFMDRPFEVGDWVRLPERDIEGTVETIDWRLTRLRTFDKRPLYVPNATFSYAVMENPSRMTHRRINTVIGIRYQDSDKLDKIIHDVKQVVSEHPGIDSKQTLLCNFIEFGQSSLNFIIYAFTHTIDWAEFYDIQQQIYFKTIDIIHQHGAKCALPAKDVHFAEVLAYRSQTHEIGE
jgi:MscS family membrane protein